jgi:hypothetical protein
MLVDCLQPRDLAGHGHNHRRSALTSSGDRMRQASSPRDEHTTLRQVMVMFSDLVGSALLSTRMDWA